MLKSVLMQLCASAFVCRWVEAGHAVNNSHMFMKSRSSSDIALTCHMAEEVYLLRDKAAKIKQVSFVSLLFSCLDTSNLLQGFSLSVVC